MSRAKRIKRIVFKLFLGLISLLFLGFAIITAPYWWRAWVTYPRLEKARAQISTGYQEPANISESDSYQGVLHAHSYWSHDSRGQLNEILPAAKQAQLDFIFFSDHPHGQLDTFPRSYHGTYEGIVMESGTEYSSGLMISPLQAGVLDWSVGEEALSQQVKEAGGFVGYVHSEDEHNWDSEHYQAMEIYNIHTDLLDEEKSFLSKLILNSIINGKKYRHWAYRELFDEQTAILQHWDELNQKRKIVGFAAVDAHNNQSFRARYLPNDQVEWVGPNAKTMKIVDPGWKEKLLLGEPDTAGWAFKFEVDTYFHSFNFVNTHVFSDSLSSRNIIDHILKGHAFISFESLAAASGFQFVAQDASQNIIGMMGDSISVDQVTQFKALSPYPVAFKLVRDGQSIEKTEAAYDFTFKPDGQTGNYRLVASLLLGDQWTPWVYTNPIYLY